MKNKIILMMFFSLLLVGLKIEAFAPLTLVSFDVLETSISPNGDGVNDIINILEAKAVILDPVSHDKLSVLSSHLPLILGNILIGTILREHQWHNVEKIISTGFMDTTRLASDNPLLKSDIIRTNSQNIIDSLNKYKQELDYFIKLVQSDNKRKILSYLKNSKLRRDKLLSCN